MSRRFLSIPLGDVVAQPAGSPMDVSRAYGSGPDAWRTGLRGLMRSYGLSLMQQFAIVGVNAADSSKVPKATSHSWSEMKAAAN